jgi:hypothetical protein
MKNRLACLVLMTAAACGGTTGQKLTLDAGVPIAEGQADGAIAAGPDALATKPDVQITTPNSDHVPTPALPFASLSIRRGSIA